VRPKTWTLQNKRTPKGTLLPLGVPYFVAEDAAFAVLMYEPFTKGAALLLFGINFSFSGHPKDKSQKRRILK